VSNYSIASARIVNYNRSPNAIVLFDFDTHIRILQDDNLEEFNKHLTDYVHDHPRVWESVVFCRPDTIDHNNELVSFR
jgi:hypothetical protein